MQQRTFKQNKALHAFNKAICKEFIEKGITLNMLVRNIEIYPTKENIKDIQRSIAKTKYNKAHTSELTVTEMIDVIDTFVIALNKIGIETDFAQETQRLADFYKNDIMR